MPSTVVVWFRRDLRLHDHPPLVRALRDHDQVVPVFVFDPALIRGRFPSAGRTQFLLESLAELDRALRARGASLVVRTGRPEEEIVGLAAEVGAEAVYLAADVSPYARARDHRARAALEQAGIEAVFTPANFCADIGSIATGQGRPYTVFSPFYRAWCDLDRRVVHRAPATIPMPAGVRPGRLPALSDFALQAELAAPSPGGETEGRRRLTRFLSGPIDSYAEDHNRLAGGTSELSAHIHFGNVSVREIEERAERRDGRGPAAFRRQLAWRDFYAHVLLNHPESARSAHRSERYRALPTDTAPDLLRAWQEGRTGYPIVDAGMRQLRTTGWMHNRARLVVASFLTKDLHLDWKLGEAHFMRYLLCGDEAQNTGNWQWVASLGVDPAPYFRRMYNPTLHQRRFDPDGEYVRRWVPELARVPLERLAEPWTMDREEQVASGCVVGCDYPRPIVDHREERPRAMERYRLATAREGGG